MEWLRVVMYCNSADTEIISAILVALGQDELVIDDGALVNELLNQEQRDWDYISNDLLDKDRNLARMEFCLPYANQTENEEFIKSVKDALEELKIENVKIFVEVIDEDSWKDTWKEFFHPLQVGENLVIKPTWEAYEAKPGQVVIEMDPGQAFGSGSHATTSLVLESLEAKLKPGDLVLDIGCGSGILGITAALLGAKKVIGIDNDPKAIEVSRDNARLNQVDHVLQAVLGDLVCGLEGEFEIIVANLTAENIMNIAPILKPYLKNSGYFIPSGIISQRAQEVEKVLLDNGYLIEEAFARDDWRSYVLKKKNP